MTTEPAVLPTWCAEGKQAVALTSHLQPGAGVYHEAHPVLVTRITRTQVRVQGDGFRSDAETVFVRGTLRERGVDASSAAVLADPVGIEARAVQREIKTASVLRKTVRAIVSVEDLIRKSAGRGIVARDVIGTIEHNIINLDDLIRVAINARNALIDLKEG